MPTNKQSIAGSLLQTLTRLCTAVGYGIATAVFDAVEGHPSASGYYANNVIEPFAAVFWFAAACAFIGTLFVPFLRIGTQGHRGDTGRLKATVEAASGLNGLIGEHAVIANEKGLETSLVRDDRLNV